MTNFLPVQINSAAAEEIGALYDIGPRRAQQIIDYRTTNGPFHGPDDLAKVKEITPKLAYTLSPHIDWRLPAEPEPPKQRSWRDAGLWLVVLLCLLPATLLLLLLVVNALWQAATVEPIKIAAAVSGIGALVCFALFAGLRMSVALSRERRRAQQLARAALGSMAIALFVGVPLLLGTVAYWWGSIGPTEDSSKAGQTLLTPSMGLFALLLLYLFMTPQIIVWWRPALADSRWLARIFDAAFLLAGLALIGGLRLQIDGWPFWFLLLAALAGSLIIVIAILAVRRGDSFFRTTLDFLDTRRRWQETITADAWRYWIAVHLPEPEHQKSMQAALTEMHRPTAGQTLLKTFILGMGYWFLLTVIEAIVELYAQDLWAKLFGAQ
ncbi:MAG: helix-hairpin-helix domain-containing protein [Caldilinea sp. CFX5]|nr:helix-hairpin-helix domain-containing protein [Caldilinea sp. CFX5]